MATRKGYLVADICSTLVDRIVGGVYLPGKKLSQDELAEELEVSRTPLREALNRLQQMILVVATTNRGVAVAPLSFEETEQWYAMRLLIEPPIVAALTQYLSLKDLALMSEALGRMQIFADRTADFQDAHHAFHRVVLTYYPEYIRDTIEYIYLKITRHQRVYFSRPRAPEEFCETDRLYLKALTDGNGQLAKRILEFHLIDAALGLILDAEPDYRPDNLMLVVRGLGLRLETDEAGHLSRPVRLVWEKCTIDVPLLRTSNLIYMPEKKSPQLKGQSRRNPRAAGLIS
ncbi:GntR family transcriptional regulator [Eoetvoesiella caeni]